MKYIFDIDGTLTNPRQEINPEFEEFFYMWIRHHAVYLVTGSDYEKTLEQAGERILNSVKSCYNCAGNIQYIQGIEISRNEMENVEILEQFLQKLLESSEYPIKVGNHIEIRTGMVNFSPIGRNCTQEQREEYYRWDKDSGQRLRIQKQIQESFPRLAVHIGGQISLDICDIGSDKSQILKNIEGPYTFFGDKTLKGGNDYDIAKAVVESGGTAHQVTGWKETYSILRTI